MRAWRGIGVAVALVGLAGAADALTVGDAAPDFALPDHRGQVIRLSDFRGKQHVVLAFYIRAFTPG